MPLRQKHTTNFLWMTGIIAVAEISEGEGPLVQSPRQLTWYPSHSENAPFPQRCATIILGAIYGTIMYVSDVAAEMSWRGGALMDDHDLEAFLLDLESDRVERKSSAANGNELRRAICAFANDLPNHQQPGILFIGVRDDGSCANLGITDELLRTLADMRSDGNILPLPTMTIQKKTLRGCELAVIVVEPSDAPPVRFRGCVWVRFGPRKANATIEEERRLTEKRRARDLPFDIRPMSAARLADLALELFRRDYLSATLPVDVLEANQRSAEDQLSSLRFVAVEPPSTPTNLGLLVVGQDPRQFFPGAYLQFLRIEGKELTDPIKNQKEIDGPLPDLLRRLDEVLQAHIAIASDLTTQGSIR